jgi:hypothetical protein
MSQPKVNELDRVVWGDEDIFQFNVAMDYALGVNVLHNL